MSLPKTISILGATGSIGRSAADVISSAPEKFDVQTLTAYSDHKGLVELAIKLHAKRVVIGDEALYPVLKDSLDGSGIEVHAGREALIHSVYESIDLCVSAITGMAGLEPLLEAIKYSNVLAIANKEPLVAAGELVISEANKHNCTILPIDSEHNAVFQVFNPEQKNSVERIILTASGGPFRTWEKEQMAAATPEQALAHPTWTMGRKISIDSATMMNKALEIIEAHVLFGLSPEKIQVIVHPQSIVHSMVEYQDGSILAQMGASDMRTPIAFCLAWPCRMATPGQKLDLTMLKRLDFEEPNFDRFPSLGMAYECLKHHDGSYALAMNAANEIAVDAFLKRAIPFSCIIETIRHVLDSFQGEVISDLETAIHLDGLARRKANAYITEAYAKA